MAQLLPRYYARQQEREDERRLARILLETGASDTTPGTALTRSADGHEWARRRGLPLVGRGIGGTAPGTSPLGALMRKENGRRQR